MGQEMRELRSSFQKRELDLVKASFRFIECKQHKPILINLSKKGKVLARNWVVKRRKKRFKRGL